MEAAGSTDSGSGGYNEGQRGCEVEERRVPDSEVIGRIRRIRRKLKLSGDWALNAIRAVGNYGEIYDRDLGMNSPLKIPRGPNELTIHGGLLYPLPLRIHPNDR